METQPLLDDDTSSVNSAEQKRKSLLPSPHLISFLLMCFGFLSVFVAYNGTQNLASSIIGKLGYWSIASVYVGFCFGSLLVAPVVVIYLKPKYSMVLGSITYALFMVANLYPDYYTLIPSATLLGVGASILWAAQGSHLTISAANYAREQNKYIKSTMGLFNGTFFGIFYLSQVIGNIISSLILSQNGSYNFLFYIYLAIAGVGVFLLCIVKSEDPINDISDPKHNSLLVKILKAVLLLRSSTLLFLIPCIFYSGLEMGFLFGDFTSEVIKPTHGQHWIGYIMAVFGGVDALSSFIFGYVADMFGKKILVFFGFVTHAAFFGFFIYFFYADSDPLQYFRSNLWSLFFFASLYGVGDSVWNTFPSVMCSSFFTTQTEEAFSNLKLWQSLGFVLAFFWGPILSFFNKLLIAASCLVFGTICILILNFWILNIDKRTSII